MAELFLTSCTLEIGAHLCVLQSISVYTLCMQEVCTCHWTQCQHTHTLCEGRHTCCEVVVGRDVDPVSFIPARTGNHDGSLVQPVHSSSDGGPDASPVRDSATSPAAKTQSLSDDGSNELLRLDEERVNTTVDLLSYSPVRYNRSELEMHDFFRAERRPFRTQLFPKDQELIPAQTRAEGHNSEFSQESGVHPFHRSPSPQEEQEQGLELVASSESTAHSELGAGRLPEPESPPPQGQVKKTKKKY